MPPVKLPKSRMVTTRIVSAGDTRIRKRTSLKYFRLRWLRYRLSNILTAERGHRGSWTPACFVEIELCREVKSVNWWFRVRGVSAKRIL